MALAQAHRINHEIIQIHEDDTAWDRERIDYELGVLEGRISADPDRPVPWKSRDDHPWVRYVNGQARGDVRTVEEYLKHRDGPEGPVRFHFKRMGQGHWSTFNSIKDQGLAYQARMFALQCSLVSVDGVTLKRPKKTNMLTDADVKLLRETFGDAVLEDMCFLAVAFSRELTDAEKKL